MNNVADEPRLSQVYEYDERLAARFWRKVDMNGPIPSNPRAYGPCWIWLGSKDQRGYGRLQRGRRGEGHVKAHRLGYELWEQRCIPEGIEPDHLCENPSCVKAAHLELVPHRENVLRGKSPVARHAAATHCPHGHEYTPENTYLTPKQGHRQCRICIQRRSLARRKK